MAKAFSRIDAQSERQSDQALKLIKNAIILCHLPPGTSFSEAELSGRFGLARAATRAALMRLAEVGLVEPVARHGFLVTPITVASIRELFELRLMIEPQAAALAIGKVDVAKLRKLNSSAHLAGNDSQQLDFVEHNRAFHAEIAAATGNHRLFRLLESLADEMQRLVRLGLFGASGSEAERRNADSQHEALIAAFEAGDREGAKNAARHHIEHARMLVLNHAPISNSPISLT
jgi:DNA-binding GntR family transcriptional regulator